MTIARGDIVAFRKTDNAIVVSLSVEHGTVRIAWDEADGSTISREVDLADLLLVKRASYGAIQKPSGKDENAEP